MNFGGWRFVGFVGGIKMGEINIVGNEFVDAGIFG